MDELTVDSGDQVQSSPSSSQIIDAIANSDTSTASDSIKNALFVKASEVLQVEREKKSHSMFGVFPTQEES
jgi:hypothetical protein